MEAASGGHDAVVRLLLSWPGSAPRADIRKGYALTCAIRCGHEHVVRTLMAWPENAPRVTYDPYANFWAPVRDPLTMAAHVGNGALVRMLMETLPRQSPPQYNVVNRDYMIASALTHEEIVHILLEGLDESRIIGDLGGHIGEAILRAALCWHDGTVRTLWPVWERSNFQRRYFGYTYSSAVYAKLVCQGKD